MAPYKISIKCDFEEFWRYNYIVTGEVLIGEQRTDFIKYSNIAKAIDSDGHFDPDKVDKCRDVVLETAAGEHLILYIYVVPHAMPTIRDVKDAKFFTMHIAVEQDGKMLHSRHHDINPYSGINLELKF